jgi:3-oxoacyl-[acyl-carrier-protein] synthase-3
MGARWVSDIIADNNPDDDSYHMNGQFVLKNAVVLLLRSLTKD